MGEDDEVTGMKRMWKRLLAIVMCLALVVPMGAMAEGATVRYGVVTDNQVNVRKTAGGDGALWFKVDEGHVGQILGETTVKGVVWHKISTGHPTPNGRTYIGWIHQDYLREMTAAEVEAYLNGQEIPGTEEEDTGMKPSVDDALQGGEGHTEYTGKDVVGAKGKVTGDANFRTEPSTKTGAIICEIAKDTEVDITGVPQEGDVNGWYRVMYQGKAGFVFCDLIELLDTGAEPTPAPGFGTEVTGVIGEVTTTKVNLRTEAKKDTNNANVIVQLNPGQEFEILTVPDTVSEKTWYRVRYNGEVGYIQANFVRIVSGETPVPELPDQGDGEVTVHATGMVTADKVNFRMSDSITASIYGKVNTGTVVQLLSIPTKIDDQHWFRVFYNGKTGYIQAPFIRVLSVDEDSLPSAEIFGYAKLLEDSVNLRVSAGGDPITEWSGKGSLLRITGEPVFNSGYNWYPVFYASAHAIYYVREDMIQIMAVEGGTLVTPAPTESSYGYIITTKTGVNLRSVNNGVVGDSRAQVPKNTILACVGPSLSPSETDSSYTWYKVRYNGIIGYLRGDCVRVCNSTGGSIVEPEPDDPTPPVEDVLSGYIRLTKTDVALREERAGKVKTRLPLGLILPYYGDITPAGKFGRYCWYYVKTADGLVGYIRGDCAVICDGDGTEVTPKPDGTEVTGVKGRLLQNANFRREANFDGTIISLIPADTIVDVLIVPNDKVNGWYKIKYNGEEGFVLASHLKQLEPGSEVTPGPSVSAFGYVMINDEKVAFRNAPAGNTIYTRLENGTVWPMNGIVQTVNGVKWYPISVNGKPGYVHGGFSFKLSPAQEESYLAGNGVPEEDTGSDSVLTSYIITTYDDVNLRDSYSLDATRIFQVDKGTAMPYSDTKLVGTVTWYNVVYNHQSLWVHGKYVEVMTAKEYQDYVAANPDFETDPSTNRGYVKLTADNVYIRNAAAGSIIDQLRKGAVLPYYVEEIQDIKGEFYWFRVQTPEGKFGYIRADMVEKCEANGDPLPAPTPDMGDITSAPKMQQMTTYTNLYQGMTNSESNQARVRNLVQELINQGYYTGSLTSTYTSEVKEAVKNFQILNDLSPTGTADSATQHALFGTRPDKAGDTSNLEFYIYPVEKIDWFTGGIQEMLPRGAKFKIYDVKTKIVWWAYRQAGGKHMDIETLTAEDSKRLCEIYGVSNLQEIVDKNKWQRRPCLITIGTRTFAASLDGMQHGADTISNNGMDGQVCLHFTNSQGHASGEVSTSHKEAIEYAYNNCPAGKK